jgi:hypothetical protein
MKHRIFWRRSKEGRTLGCPRSDKTVTGNNNQTRTRHHNVHWRRRQSLSNIQTMGGHRSVRATFKCIQRKDMNVPWWRNEICDRSCRTYVGCVRCGGAQVHNGRACVETPYYRSSSHTMCVNMPLGANNSSLGAERP